MKAGAGVEKQHTVSPLALCFTARFPILRVKRGTFPAAQPPLLSSPPSTQQMHAALSWAAFSFSLSLLLLFPSGVDSAWCAGGNGSFSGAVQSQAHRS